MTTNTHEGEEVTVKDGVTYHQFDVVIVGAGGAGMRAAIEAGPKAKTAAVIPEPQVSTVSGPVLPAKSARSASGARKRPSEVS